MNPELPPEERKGTSHEPGKVQGLPEKGPQPPPVSQSKPPPPPKLGGSVDQPKVNSATQSQPRSQAPIQAQSQAGQHSGGTKKRNSGLHPFLKFVIFAFVVVIGGPIIGAIFNLITGLIHVGNSAMMAWTCGIATMILMALLVRGIEMLLFPFWILRWVFNGFKDPDSGKKTSEGPSKFGWMIFPLGLGLSLLYALILDGNDMGYSYLGTWIRVFPLSMFWAAFGFFADRKEWFSFEDN